MRSMWGAMTYPSFKMKPFVLGSALKSARLLHYHIPTLWWQNEPWTEDWALGRVLDFGVYRPVLTETAK